MRSAPRALARCSCDVTIGAVDARYHLGAVGTCTRFTRLVRGCGWCAASTTLRDITIGAVGAGVRVRLVCAISPSVGWLGVRDITIGAVDCGCGCFHHRCGCFGRFHHRCDWLSTIGAVVFTIGAVGYGWLSVRLVGAVGANAPAQAEHK
jgi:hypothetical protein